MLSQTALAASVSSRAQADKSAVFIGPMAAVWHHGWGFVAFATAFVSLSAGPLGLPDPEHLPGLGARGIKKGVRYCRISSFMDKRLTAASHGAPPLRI